MAPRDYFAGLAMQSLIRSSNFSEMLDEGERLDIDDLNSCFIQLSLQSYMLADQMCGARLQNADVFGQLCIEFFGKEKKESE